MPEELASGIALANQKASAEIESAKGPVQALPENTAN
jgi:hypothetical protein